MFLLLLEEEDQSSKQIKEVSQIKLKISCCNLKDCGGTIVLVSTV